MNVEIVVLAAGEGRRMRSDVPKVLHEIGGKPMLAHVLDVARTLGPMAIRVVVGAGGEAVRRCFVGQADLVWVEQAQRLGTGHATLQAMPAVAEETTTLVLCGDAPLIKTDTLVRCAAASEQSGGLALVTADAPDPAGLGRIVRDGRGQVQAIVEERDATPAQQSITEINSGIMAAPAKLLKRLLAGIGSDNAQGEHYLTDAVGVAARDGVLVVALKAGSYAEVAGVNDRVQLAAAERLHQHRRATTFMGDGLTLLDPARFDVRGDLHFGRDCSVDVNVVFEGEVTLGAGVRIGPNCLIRNATLEDGCRVEANTVVDGAHIGANASVGPFARLRPGTELGADVRIGNFVETKQARIGDGAKANHLAYLGDAAVGAGSNIGAGAITCNYDGAAKHETRIGDRAFIGTNATLVAPLEIGDDAYVGAGSTVTSRVAPGDLAVGRAKQRNIKGWTPPARRKRQR